jgi:hypothetical protein
MGSSDSRSRNKQRLDLISNTLKVSADAFDGEGLAQSVSVNSVHLSEQSGIGSQRSEYPSFHHSGDSSNILTNDPSGPDFVNSAEHLRPEVTLVLSPPPLSRVGKRLAGKSSCEDVHAPPPLCKVCFCDVVITFRIREPILQHGTAEGVYLAVEHVVPAHHGGGHFRPADPAE